VRASGAGRGARPEALAARVHHVNEEGAIDLYRTINTEGTLQLARSAAKAGVKRFTFVSNMLVNGSCSDDRGPFPETDEFAPRGVYGLSKAEAEFGLAECLQMFRCKSPIIRPPLVYGPGLPEFQALGQSDSAWRPLFGSVAIVARS
jgi:UDP-glucose 4-epimerase